MRYFLTFACIVLHLISFSQDYKTIYPNRVSTFAKLYYNYDEYSFGAICFNNYDPNYYAIEIDSSKIINTDTIYYHFNVIRRDTGSSYGYYKRLSNWTGSKTIIKTNGDNVFFARNGDSIRIKTKAGLNDKWHLYDFPNGNYFEGEVTTKSLEVILGNNDSLKVITISLKDNIGNPLPHDFNGKEIILSKYHGITKAYDFSSFPNDTISFTLFGLSNPALGIQNITAKEIFDYNVGDEFHIEDNNSNVPYSGTFDTERRIILSKNISLNEDTVQYEYERILYRKTYNYQNSTGDTIIIKDTLTEKNIVGVYSALNLVSMKLIAFSSSYDINNYCFYRSQYNNRLQKVRDILIAETNDTCFGEVMYSPATTWYYLEGLGVYYNGDEGVNQFHRTLLYYKKGTETWGTPVNFSALLSTADKIKSEINIEIFPNPFTDYTKIKINNHIGSIYKLTISDMYGKTVKEISFTENEILIHKDGLTNGIYIYKIQNDKNHISTGKIIVSNF